MDTANVVAEVLNTCLATALCGIGAIGVKEKMAEWKARRLAIETHLKECASRETRHALEAQRLEVLEEKMCNADTTLTWVGDCVQRVGAKLNVDLPQRPVNP